MRSAILPLLARRRPSVADRAGDARHVEGDEHRHQGQVRAERAAAMSLRQHRDRTPFIGPPSALVPEAPEHLASAINAKQTLVR